MAPWTTEARSTRSLRSWRRPRRDAADVEQVVDQADHVGDLALHEGAGLVDGGGVFAGEAHDLEAVADGGQGVAELVGEGGEELVLLAILLA